MGVEIGARMRWEKPKGSGCWRGKLTVGPREHRAYRGAWIISGGQYVKAALFLVEFCGQRVETYAWASDCELGNDPQGQRKPDALINEFVGGVKIRVDSRADQHAEQLYRLHYRQQVKIDSTSAVAGD
ncbi:MAG: hypothetical protein M3332_06225 [Actinomycetota bacterium]|nr:hypothetical protein [Actinomycetota bacterium]